MKAASRAVASGSKSEVKVMTFQPTVSYAFNDKVSIGFGPTINRISGVLESDKTISPLANDTNVKIKGDDTALGFNVGVLVQATDTTRVGLTYHSKVKYKLEGHTTVSGPAATQPVLRNNRYDASLKIDTPESWDASVLQDLTADWKLYGGATWTRWSRLKEITVNNEGVTAASGIGAAAIKTIQRAAKLARHLGLRRGYLVPADQARLCCVPA